MGVQYHLDYYRYRNVSRKNPQEEARKRCLVPLVFQAFPQTVRCMNSSKVRSNTTKFSGEREHLFLDATGIQHHESKVCFQVIGRH